MVEHSADLRSTDSGDQVYCSCGWRSESGDLVTVAEEWNGHVAPARPEPLIVGWAVWLCPLCQELVSRGEGAREGDAHCAGSLTERTHHERTPMKPVDVVERRIAEDYRDRLHELQASRLAGALDRLAAIQSPRG